jgi:hypothetical protein
MCGRARLSSDVSAITSAFGIPPERPTPHVAASWNVAPTDPLPIVRYEAKDQRRSLQVRRWGLVPFWVKDIKAGFANINVKTAGVALARQPDRWGTTTRACPQRQPSSTPRLLVGRPEHVHNGPRVDNGLGVGPETAVVQGGGGDGRQALRGHIHFPQGPRQLQDATQAVDRVCCRQTGLGVAHAALGDTDRVGDEPLAIGTGLEVVPHRVG